MVQLPADGVYCLHLGDTGRKGGEEYGYRLRLSAPRPDFAMRSVPSSVSLRGKSTATVSVHAQRLDGFDGPIRVALRNPPPGFSATPVTLFATQTVARLTLKCDLPATPEPVNLVIQGSARIGENEIVREAMPAEDRMQAFLWRHLVPASELKVLAFNPANEPRPRRSAPAAKSSRVATNMMASATTSTATNAAAAKPKFTRQQINSRLRQLRLLYEEDLLTDRFYREKVAECETAL